jgi:two-component system sensor kinase FixL
MRFRLLLGFMASYLLLDWLSYVHPLQQSSITPWNPHPALAVGLLAICGQRWFPAVLLATFAAEVLVRHMPAGPGTTLLVALVLSLGYAAIAAALSGLIASGDALRSRRGLLRLIGVIATGTLVTGALYVGALWASGAELPAPYFEALLQFWIGDCVGILVTLPLLLIWQDSVRWAEFKAAFREPSLYLQMLLIGVALWLVFGPLFAQPFKFFYVLFLPLIWAAVRFGLHGAALAVLEIQLGVISVAQLTAYPALTVFELQALLIAVTITGLFLGVTVDERRRAIHDLKQSLRLAAAGEMSAAIAHELNQPLAALGTYARAAVLLSQAEDVDRARLAETLRKVVAESNRAADVVRRLRDFFRTGATELRSQSLPELAGAVAHDYRGQADQQGVEIEQRVDGSPREVLIDRLQIEVVLRNLLANGIEAASQGPRPRTVVIEIGPAGDGFVQTMVRDSGSGVAPEMREQVFEPFWSSRASGMGMGLAISRAIIEAHGGRIWLEGGGHGAFGFTLPVTDA